MEQQTTKKKYTNIIRTIAGPLTAAAFVAGAVSPAWLILSTVFFMGVLSLLAVMDIKGY